MENARDFVKDYKSRGAGRKKSTRIESLVTVPLGTTPQESSKSTSKPSLRSSLQELQLMLGPETLKLCKGLDDLNKAVDAEDLQALMRAIRQIKAANAAITSSCSTIELKLFEIQDPAWKKISETPLSDTPGSERS